MKLSLPFLVSLSCSFLFVGAEEQGGSGDSVTAQDSAARDLRFRKWRRWGPKRQNSKPKPGKALSQLNDNISNNNNGCGRGSRFMLAVRCNDGTESLHCAPIPNADHESICVTTPINDSWAKGQCNHHGGFDHVLPYYSGCYPASVDDFWQRYAPDVEFNQNNLLCVANIPVPAMNPANLNFEDTTLGITGWDRIALGADRFVDQKCDQPSKCESRNTCKAHSGSCYAEISAGDSQHLVTLPNTLRRSDFRIPEVDGKMCGSVTPKFCFSFAMRFIAHDDHNIGNDDYFTVEVQLDKIGEMLFEETIRVSDVYDEGSDSGWKEVTVELPRVPLGQQTFFEFRAMTTNVGDYALDSIGYIDDLQIAPCA